MKKIILLFALLTMAVSSAQVKPVQKEQQPNVVMDANGNYKEIQDVNTGRLYYDKEGRSYPVFRTKNGKLYAITKISAKTGKPVRKYIKA